MSTFDDVRQAICHGLSAAQSEARGWNVMRASIPVNAVVRTSDTVVTITLPALPTYQIAAPETISCTLPAAALTGAVPIVATTTIRILTAGVAALVGTASLRITAVAVLTTRRRKKGGRGAV